MKRLLGIILSLIPLLSLAGNGDTMTIRTHNRVHMNWNGNYDRTQVFPTAGKKYQRIKMHYTLGCPDKGCSEWDYTVQTFLRRKTGRMDSTLRNTPNFRVNGNPTDSFRYRLDTVYSYFYNGSTFMLDSTADAPVQLILFADASNPTVATDTLEVWNAYRFRPNFDGNGTLIDSAEIAYDQILYRQDHQYYQVFEVIDDLELGRLITPYAADKDRFWTFTYTYDVTEFAHLLQDTVTIRSRYSGYQDGFTCTIDFEFVEGEPALECTEIIPLWRGSFPYGQPKGIEEYLIEKNVTLSKSPTQKVKLRVIQTGHGFGGNENCAEFCAKEHYVKVNGEQRYKTLVWKDDCGSNALYPQPGTWLYDRANWCPGEAVNAYDYWIDDYLVDGSNTIDLDMQPFTNINNNNNSYIISGFLLVYEENPDALVDAALDEIIAPNTKDNFNRFNPTCGLPRVRVKNTSMKKIETLVFRYGIKGGAMHEWGWEGEILPYESKEIDLAFFDWTGAKVGEFECSIIKANGLADGNEFNNTRTSSFALTPQFPEEFQIWFKSNNKGSETTLSVHELDGRVIWSRTDFGPSETTRDTIRLVDGCYYFKITDSKRNGIKFWAIPDGTGSLNLRQMSGQIIQSIDGDFGTDRVVHFTVGHPLGAPEIMDNPEVLVYPNPNSGKLTVAFTGKGATTLRLLSMDGKELERRHLDVAGELQEEWDLSTLPTGIYLMEYQGPDGRHIEKIVKE